LAAAVGLVAVELGLALGLLWFLRLRPQPNRALAAAD